MKNILVLLAASILMSCSAQSLDLSQIDFNRPAGQYLDKLNISAVEQQKGHFEILKNGDKVRLELKDNGEVCTIYTLREAGDAAQIRFSGFSLEPDAGGRIISYKDKIAFYNCHPDRTRTFEVLSKLKEMLGKPDEIVTDTLSLNDGTAPLLSKKLPATDFKIFKDEFGEYITCPRHYIWKKGDMIYQYTFIRGSKTIANDLVAMNIQAFKDRIIFGFHNPAQDPVLSKYVK
ncbi:hypothetical protein HDF26_000516 [Pedobacter cryoconitis]|uniref:hypothetical protein n=1 Tax=Pedobacter cryoconitis TaxID=188932 RepID=UPI0016134D13|nr:hypothetical protein [Pedobacter cryoconitis]MBB6270089.1 hypothetical protein [Pedobacter cryoconitis]